MKVVFKSNIFYNGRLYKKNEEVDIDEADMKILDGYFMIKEGKQFIAPKDKMLRKDDAVIKSLK